MWEKLLNKSANEDKASVLGDFLPMQIDPNRRPTAFSEKKQNQSQVPVTGIIITLITLQR